MRRLLDANGGVISVYEDLPGDEGFVIREYFDEVPVIEHNKRLQNDGDGYSKSRELRRAASIPNGLVAKWLVEEGINIFNPNHAEAIRRKLNDPEYRWLRTAPGRL